MRYRILTIAWMLLMPALGYGASCPGGFLELKNRLGSLGCVQKEVVRKKDGKALQLNWFSASDYCFDRHGGRLPTAQEIAIAGSNLTLTSPTAPVWTGGFFFDGGEKAITGRILQGPNGTKVIDLGYAPGTQNQVFRCWYPR